MESVGKNAWAVVEVGERRVLPALPEADADLGQIRWDRWERHLVMTHIDPGCDTCGYVGPLAVAKGMTLHQDPPRRKLLQRSAVVKGQRAVGGPLVTPAPRWVYTHFATRCQACDEMLVWVMSGKRPRCTECAAVSPMEFADRKVQCLVCFKDAEHVVPMGSSLFRTWIEVAYNPPNVERVPLDDRRKPPQEETLF